MGRDGADVTVTRTVGKALDILECLASQKQPLSTSQIARECGLNRATTYRLLVTLTQRGYVTRTLSEEKYRLGYRLLELSKSLLDSIDLVTLAIPHLRELTQFANETTYLAVLDGSSVVYIGKLDSDQALRMHSAIGSRNPVHCTALGKAILAYLPPDTMSSILRASTLERKTPRTITDPDELAMHLQQVRRQGFALDDLENEDGIRCIAAPIFAHDGTVTAAVSLAGPAHRLTLEQAYALADRVKATSAAVSLEIGCSSPPNTNGAGSLIK